MRHKTNYNDDSKAKRFRNVFANLIISVMLVGVFALTYAGGVLNVFSSSSDGFAIYHGNTDNKNVSLMVNVYWGTEYIEPMLEVLEEKGAKCTFFVGGVWASSNEELLKKIIDGGHELGNHGYNHLDHDKISKEKNEKEIYQTHEIVKALTGVEMNLFAPPSGAYNQTTLDIAKTYGYQTIMWTKDTIDWRDKNTELIYNRAINNPQNGDLILMHPTKNTLEALGDIIDFYLDKDFNIVTVSDNIAWAKGAPALAGKCPFRT